jgi:acetylornithine deacetylase/succinyl-diaminopimelate desuccinylase-like protein
MELLRFPSISGDGAYRSQLDACAGWLAEHLCRIGLTHVELRRTPTAPVVIGTIGRRPQQPHVLVYGHYDVQPVVPLSAWTIPPFEPTILGHDLHGRGASDDKGQFFAHLAALECVLRTSDRLPMTITFVLEGEEEIGSPHLGEVIRALFDDGVRPTVTVMSDTRMLASDRPAIVTALRGSLQLEIRVSRAGHDLHAGAFGGAMLNPAHVLADVVSSLHDRGGRVAIQNFYAGAAHPSRWERDRLARDGPCDSTLQWQAHGAPLNGDRRFTAFERATIRPALNVTGMSSGYEGPGNRNAIPTSATARVNVRLVDGQDPERVFHQVADHVAAASPATSTATVTMGACTPPTRLDRGGVEIRRASLAYRRAFGRDPVLLPTGGSIPAVPLLRATFGVPVVLMGFGLPDDNMHAPNEKLSLPVLWRAVDTCIWYLHSFNAPLSRRTDLPGRFDQ